MKKYNLNRILEQFSILQIVEEYGVDLEYSNGGYIALCPFHDDVATKSFRIYEYSDSWFCFGCQKGGTIFDFVMNFENVSFAKAVEILAQRAGITESNALEDLHIQMPPFLQEFMEKREIIEARITDEMRKKYFNTKNFPIFDQQRVLLDRIFELWKWIDKGYKFFEKKMLQYKIKKKRKEYIDNREFFGFLNNKLISFYAKFIEKLEEIK